jgi:hypothetical protein
MQPPQRRPPVPHIPNPEQPTVFVTAVNCEVLGGSFVFELAEL